MLRLISLTLLCAFCTSIFAQNITTKRSGNDFIFTGYSGELKISFCTPSMFRVQLSPDRKYEPDEPWMVVKYDWAQVPVTQSAKAGGWQLATSNLILHISRQLRLEVRSADGKLLSSENGTGSGAFAKGDSVGCTKNMQPDEHFFGFGERMDFLDRRAKNLRLNVGRGKGLPHYIGAYNVLEANYSPVPFFMSTAGYGIFFHTAYPTEWDMGSSVNDRYRFSASGGVLDYYFIGGPRFTSILNQYTSLTGRAPLMPRFAYGLHVGTYSGGTWGHEHHTSDRYVIALARKLREMGTPVDILWLDSTWRIFGEVGGKGATSFEWRETFSDPKGMFDSLYALNFKMVGLHLRPRFDNGKKIRLLDTAQQLKFTYPEGDSPGEFVNFFDKRSVDFWWDHGVKRVADLGARFLKTDEGSAFGGLANESNKTGPQGKDIEKLHNLFPLAYAKAPYEKFQQHNNMRGLNQTREGYAGIQRYPFIFAGDWPSEWQYFAPVIKAGLNIGLSGVGNWAHCMGGFEHVADPELYTRWVQFGMLSPVALVFGMDHPGYKEPWNYGPDALRNFRKYDSLRYALLPYIYSNAYKMYRTGEPLMRALVLDHQDDPNVYEIGDQYLFGSDLMVCPVTTKAANTRTVYLPKGEWWDFWTGQRYKGGQYIHALTPLDTMPLFVRGGAVIPVQPPVQFVDEKKAEELALDIFPGPASSFELYEDDGTSLGYQKGLSSVRRITTGTTSNGFRVLVGRPEGNYKSSVQRFVMRIRSQVKPRSVTVNGVEWKETAAPSNNGSYSYDAAKGLITVRPLSSAAGAIEVIVR